MELSSAKRAEAKKLGVTTSELIYADLLSIGYGEADAYVIAYPEDAILSLQNQQANRKKITSRISFVELCEQRKLSNANILAFSGDTSDIELIDNEISNLVARDVLLVKMVV